MTKPRILRAAADLPASTVEDLVRLFDVVDLPDADQVDFLRQHGAGIRGVALRQARLDADMIAALPDLQVIATYSAGLDNIDVAAAKARGIVIANASRVLAAEVANTAVMLLLAVTRQLITADQFVRAGDWPGGEFPLNRSIVGMKVGIVGLGAIGQATATRLQALGAQVAYAGPNRKPVDLPYHDNPRDLAEASDALVIACPLTDATRHSIDAGVLEALGPDGWLVNIGRGPVVDEAALIAALAGNRIAGAGLDVFEHEPDVPEALRRDPRVVLAPHYASGTHETRQAMADNIVASLAEHFGLR